MEWKKVGTYQWSAVDAPYTISASRVRDALVYTTWRTGENRALWYSDRPQDARNAAEEHQRTGARPETPYAQR